MNAKEKHRLHNNWEYAQKYWKQRYKKLGLKEWSIKKNHTKTSLGICDHGKKTIFISTYFMRGPSCNYSRVKDTIIHEIAHALTPGQNHNMIWKKQCIALGGSGKIRDKMDIPPRNWAMSCRKCKWLKEYYRKPRMDGKVCLKCKTKPSLKSIKRN